MPILLVSDPEASPDATVGGIPRGGAETQWPACRTCGSPMQFLAQLPLGPVNQSRMHHDQVLLLFQCQSQPGLCDEWDPNAGGNSAILVESRGRVPMNVPKGETLLPAESRLRLIEYESSNHGSTPDDNYCTAYDTPDSQVVGKLGGVPLWIQTDETPVCECGTRMSFVAQLEERGGGGINFGDAGSGYVFVCESCRDRAKFLWQCG